MQLQNLTKLPAFYQIFNFRKVEENTTAAVQQVVSNEIHSEGIGQKLNFKLTVISFRGKIVTRDFQDSLDFTFLKI